MTIGEGSALRDLASDSSSEAPDAYLFPEGRAAFDAELARKRAELVEHLASRAKEAVRVGLAEISLEIECRAVKNLVHFTHLNNLENILKSGLIPRIHVANSAVLTDPNRFDRLPEASCLSISFPNSQMFTSKVTAANRDHWVVLCYPSKVLTTLPCLFFSSNATEFKGAFSSSDVPVGLNAFRKMFSQTNQGRNRQDLGIPECFPTNPQAEVLVMATIPSELMSFVYFPRKPAQRYLELWAYEYPHIKFDAAPSFFAQRMDVNRHWSDLASMKRY